MFTVFARDADAGTNWQWQTTTIINYIDGLSERTLLYAGSYDPAVTLSDEDPGASWRRMSDYSAGDGIVGWVFHEIGHALETRIISRHLYPSALFESDCHGMDYKIPADELMTLEDIKRDVAAQVFSYMLVEQSRINLENHDAILIPRDRKTIETITGPVGLRFYEDSCRVQERELDPVWKSKKAWAEFALSILYDHKHRNLHDEWQEICLDLLEERQKLSS